MKILSIFFITFLYISDVSAQVINNLVIFGNDGERFTLIINGQRYNNTPATTVTAEDIHLKVIKVKLIFENKDKKDLDTDITFFGTNNECVFGLVPKGRRKYYLDYVSSKKIIPETPSPVETTRENTNTNSTPYNTTNTSTSTIPTTPSQDHSSIGVNAGGVNVGINENGGLKLGTKDGNINMNTKDKSGDLVIGGNGTNGGIVLHKAAAKTNCPTAMNGNDFEAIKKNVSSQTSEETKLTTATTLLAGNCFSTSHVKQIMQLFKEDNSKLEFAKSAYSHTNDISNYGQVKDVLTTDEKKKELQTYLHNQKN